MSYEDITEPTRNRFDRAKKYYNERYASEMFPERGDQEFKATMGYIETGKKIRPPKPKAKDLRNIIPARNGYHGYVSQPTKFLAGERGRERVDIEPAPKRKKANSMKDFWWG